MLFSTLHVRTKVASHYIRRDVGVVRAHPPYLDGQFHMGVGVDDDSDEKVEHAPTVPASMRDQLGLRWHGGSDHQLEIANHRMIYT